MNSRSPTQPFADWKGKQAILRGCRTISLWVWLIVFGVGPGLCWAAQPLSFRYSEGKPSAGSSVRTQEAEVPETRDPVYVYVSFGPTQTNPVPLLDGQAQGWQTVALGYSAGGQFAPVVRLGLVKDTHSGMGKYSFLLPWLFDGRLDYYGMFVRPKTPYDFKIKLDLRQKLLSAWVGGRGDDNWFLLAENVALIHPTTAINAVRVEQNSGAAGVELRVQSEPWLEGEKVRSEPQVKADRVVAAGKGFKFQSMRSLWMKPDRHVTIARNNPSTAPKESAWLGFPDVVQTGPTHLVCAYVDGAAHGGGGGIRIRHSDDLGRTWGESITAHGVGVNCPRVQKLQDGSLLVLGDIYSGAYKVVIYRSEDGGQTWKSLGVLDPVKAGGHSACVPSHVVELPDGSWLLAGSWVAGNAFELTEGEQIELFRSTDQGKTWALHSVVKEYPRSLSEASLIPMPNGKLWMFVREGNRLLPGVKTYSNDNGKTWAPLQEMPFPIVGRTCAKRLRDGRVLLTARAGVGRAALWAWVGDPAEKTHAGIVGAHFNDAQSVGLKEGALHIDNNGMHGQFTQYFLRCPDSPESRIDLTAEVMVVSNQGGAATLSVPYVGKLRMFPDHVEMAHDRSLRIEVSPGKFHTYRVVAQGGQMRLWVDGQERLVTDKVDKRTVRSDWTPIRCSPYLLAFGNEPTFLASFEYNERRGERSIEEWQKSYHQDVSELQALAAIPPIIMVGTGVARDQITPRVTGYSLWRGIQVRLEETKTGVRDQSWTAGLDGFPDQYSLDRVLEVEASIGGGDQGYSGWTELEDGRIFVVNYTDDTSPACLSTPNWPTGLPWIRGTFVFPSDLP